MKPTTDPKNQSSDKELQNEGEGSRTGTRRYDEGAEKAARDPKHVAAAAEKARKELDSAEGDELRKAEKLAKEGRSS